METFSAISGISSALPGNNVAQQSSLVWRPWVGELDNSNAQQALRLPGDLCAAEHLKPPQFTHPVKLFWPKSRCFDYLYQDAERLLRNYPVQATISLYVDSSSDEESDEEEEEEMEKEANTSF